MGLRLSAAGIFLLGALGLLLHSTLPQTGHIRAGMFCFYTNWRWLSSRWAGCGGC